MSGTSSISDLQNRADMGYFVDNRSVSFKFQRQQCSPARSKRGNGHNQLLNSLAGLFSPQPQTPQQLVDKRIKPLLGKYPPRVAQQLVPLLNQLDKCIIQARDDEGKSEEVLLSQALANLSELEIKYLKSNVRSYKPFSSLDVALNNYSRSEQPTSQYHYLRAQLVSHLSEDGHGDIHTHDKPLSAARESNMSEIRVANQKHAVDSDSMASESTGCGCFSWLGSAFGMVFHWLGTLFRWIGTKIRWYCYNHNLLAYNHDCNSHLSIRTDEFD